MALALQILGHRVIKDIDLAALLGLRVRELYDHIGRKLWCFECDSVFKLPEHRARSTVDEQGMLAFDWRGVMMVAAILGDDRSLEIGLNIAEALSGRSTRARSVRWRAHDRQEDKLQGRLYELLNEQRKPRPRVGR
jgi:hypothetical protein